MRKTGHWNKFDSKMYEMRRAGTLMSNTISQEARDLIQFIHLIEFYVLIINEDEYILLYFKDGVCVFIFSQLTFISRQFAFTCLTFVIFGNFLISGAFFDTLKTFDKHEYICLTQHSSQIFTTMEPEPDYGTAIIQLVKPTEK